MNCPKCGHPITNHSYDGCHNFIGDDVGCECLLTEGDALKAAQRAAAIAHLRELADALQDMIPGWSNWKERMREIWMVADAYRAVGILPTRERKP